jgi:hypothetical protein
MKENRTSLLRLVLWKPLSGNSPEGNCNGIVAEMLQL